jgi:hypothetical protein
LEVKLANNGLGDGGLFSGLQLCTRLTALHLENFCVSKSTAIAAAAALARLSNLKELSLQPIRGGSTCPSILVKHLTALTSLCLHNSFCTDPASLCAAAARNPGLLSFSVTHPAAASVQQLLEACPSLTHLEFYCTRVQQDTLDVLLAHGTNITSLNAWSIKPSTSVAGREVSWRKLALTDEWYPTVSHLAHLPLQSVTSLQLSDHPDGRLGLLTLPTSSVPAAQLPGLLLQATTNLAKCPAWRSNPDSRLILGGDARYADGRAPAITRFTPEQRLQLIPLHALAPLAV